MSDSTNPLLTITLIQEAVVWQDPAANRQLFGEHIARLNGNSDIILLPEMFTTGYSQSESIKHAEAMDGLTLQWMLENAARTNAVIAGSLVIELPDGYANRLIWAQPDGNYQYYDKRHLFSFVGEDEIFVAGRQRKIVEHKGWRCCLQVCYDLRFPVWSRCRDDYDLLIYVASWPQSRINHWQALLKARAIENQTFVAAVNRLGEDGKGTVHNGQSIVLEPKGEALVEPGDQAGCFTATMDYGELRRYREKFGALRDRDQFSV